MKNLGKVRNFRTAEMINCKHWLPNLGEDLFLENTLILGRKLGNMRLIPSEHFFFREYHDFMTKLGLRPRLRQFFCPIRKVLEHHDLGKCHKIWTKLHFPPYFFLVGTPMLVRLPYRINFI